VATSSSLFCVVKNKNGGRNVRRYKIEPSCFSYTDDRRLKTDDLFPYFFAANPLYARFNRDLYRFAVFSCNTPFVIAWSIALSVGLSKVPAPALSPAEIAPRSFFIKLRTAVRFARRQKSFGRYAETIMKRSDHRERQWSSFRQHFGDFTFVADVRNKISLR